MMLEIRDARQEEREAIKQLTTSAYAEYASIMAPTAWEGLRGAVESGLAAEEYVERIIAVENGQIIGSVMLFSPEINPYGDDIAVADAPELRLLAVATPARGKGIGRMLVEECLRRAAENGARSLGLHTSESLQTAIHLYERLGFVRDPAYDFQPEGAELVTAYRFDLGPAEE